MLYGTAVAVDDNNYYSAVLYEDLTGCIGPDCPEQKEENTVPDVPEKLPELTLE